MTEINSSTGIVECHLWIEELLQFDGLRNGAVCAGCSTIVGAHARRSDCREPVIRSTKHCQTDFQSGETHEYEIINQQQTPSIVTKDASISPPDNPQSKHTSSDSQSISSSTSSTKSRDSAGALVRIHTAPVVSELESSKQNSAMARRLKRRAMAEASEARSRKIKNFLSEYCSSEYGDFYIVCASALLNHTVQLNGMQRLLACSTFFVWANFLRTTPNRLIAQHITKEKE